MDIKLKVNPTLDFGTYCVEDGMTIEGIINAKGDKKLQEAMPYRILLARVNGKDRELTIKPEDGDKIELLDLRTYSAHLTYQRSLVMIYLKALSDVMGEDGHSGIRGEIDNSLNKGLFTQVMKQNVYVNAKALKDDETDDVSNILGIKYENIEISEAQLERIISRMKEIIEGDLPIERLEMTADEGIDRWERYGYPEKVELLKSVKDAENKGLEFPGADSEKAEFTATFYRIDNYENYFFGPMVPSTGYIQHFELRKYKKGVLLRFPDNKDPDSIPPYRDDYKLYDAFGKEYKWLRLLKANFLSDINRIVEAGETRDMILLAEALHEKKIAEIADMIKSSGKRIVLIAGPSSSGKTTFARRLCIQLRVNGLNPLYMGTDDYFLNREFTPLDENGEKNYEDLEAMDVELFASNMNDLLAGKVVDLPEFDFMDGVKIFGRRYTQISKDQPIIIEGIHALNRKMTEQIDDREKFRIYISPFLQINIDSQNRVPTSDERMLRRMVRDYKYRGRSAAVTIRDWPKVRAGEEKNIFPYNGEADVVFNSTLVYEICMLKKYASKLLAEIKPEEPEYSEAQRLLEFFRFFRTIKEEEYVPNNSIIREFIGGSIFVE
ncbi:MAG: nucleoside kinase [Bacillota bacterium]|nr:nucleoside kinase [Bacillota bacterium]